MIQPLLPCGSTTGTPCSGATIKLLPTSSVCVVGSPYIDVEGRELDLQRRVQLGKSEPSSDMEGGGDHSLNSR